MTKASEVTKPEVKPEVNPVDTAKALAKISNSIAKIGKLMASQSLEVGKLLQEARALHETAGKFLEWAESELGYKKAYVYRLMAVSEKFGDNEDFQGVAIRVLHIVAGLPEEAQKEAAVLASEGKLDTKTAIALKPEDDEPPFEVKPVSVDLPAAKVQEQKEVQTVQVAKSQEVEQKLPDGSHTQRLLGIIESLELKLAEATSKALPDLLQFKHKSFCVRLGISQSEASDKKAVRAAYRGLLAVGYAQSQPDIKEALEYLLKEGKDII